MSFARNTKEYKDLIEFYTDPETGILTLPDDEEIWSTWMIGRISWSANAARDEYREYRAGGDYAPPNYKLYLVIILIANVIGLFLCGAFQ